MLHADNFHSNDLLCFAWQIAKGMVSNAIGDSVVSIIIFKAAKCMFDSFYESRCHKQPLRICKIQFVRYLDLTYYIYDL